MCALHIVVVVENAGVRRHVTDLLESVVRSERLGSHAANDRIEVVPCSSSAQALNNLSGRFDASEDAAAIVVSDMLVETIGRFAYARPELTSWAKELLDTFSNKPLVTVAIDDEHTRIPDIDRIVHSQCDEGQCLDTLELLTEKLSYLQRPRSQRLQNPIIVRELQSEAELLEYFQLRHRVYRVMGYIEEEIEDVPSRMEIDWCDTMAIHIGAFEIDGVSERLVGTARVMCTGLHHSEHGERVHNLAYRDTVLRRKMEADVMTMRLPIFQSMRSKHMNDLFADVAVCEKNCGELSRVIVAHDRRGAGLARLLVKFAIYQANRSGVDPLLLECLPIHERLYNKFGFQRIEGEYGRVIGVEKSMIAMELTPVTTSEFLAGAHIAAGKSILCACGHGECYSGDYLLFEGAACPLRYMF